MLGWLHREVMHCKVVEWPSHRFPVPTEDGRRQIESISGATACDCSDRRG